MNTKWSFQQLSYLIVIVCLELEIPLGVVVDLDGCNLGMVIQILKSGG